MRAGTDIGFDGGVTVWAFDLPGCVATAATEEAAVRLLPERAHEFVRWLTASGAAVTAPDDLAVSVIERVRSETLDDGYEVNATFEDDRRAVSEAEVHAVLGWLDLGHERLERAIAGAGSGPLSGEGRTADELIRHVVRAERWLATRVEADQAAIAFPREDAPILEQLAENPGFVREHVRRAGQGDGVHSRTDSKGEGWTARKVLRRLVYHVLDHAQELEQRASETRRNVGSG